MRNWKLIREEMRVQQSSRALFLFEKKIVTEMNDLKLEKIVIDWPSVCQSAEVFNGRPFHS